MRAFDIDHTHWLRTSPALSEQRTEGARARRTLAIVADNHLFAISEYVQCSARFSSFPRQDEAERNHRYRSSSGQPTTAKRKNKARNSRALFVGTDTSRLSAKKAPNVLKCSSPPRDGRGVRGECGGTRSGDWRVRPMRLQLACDSAESSVSARLSRPPLGSSALHSFSLGSVRRGEALRVMEMKMA